MPLKFTVKRLMVELELAVKETFNDMIHSSICQTLFAMFVLSCTFRALFRVVLRAADCTPEQKNEAEQNARRIVGKILNDQEKIDYILKTYDDVETASDMIADIYEKQFIREENNHD